MAPAAYPMTVDGKDLYTELATLLTREQGKPLADAKFEVGLTVGGEPHPFRAQRLGVECGP